MATLNRSSVYVQTKIQEFVEQVHDEDQQQATDVITYTLAKVPESRRGDRFYAAMKPVMKAFDNYPPKIKSITQLCGFVVDSYSGDDTGIEFTEFHKKFGAIR